MSKRGFTDMDVDESNDNARASQGPKLSFYCFSCSSEITNKESWEFLGDSCQIHKQCARGGQRKFGPNLVLPSVEAQKPY